MTRPGRETSPSQISCQKMLDVICIAELTGTSKKKSGLACLDSNSQVPGYYNLIRLQQNCVGSFSD